MKKFFIYDDDSITLNDWMCKSQDTHDDLDKSIYESFKKHRNRVYNPELADFFVVGIPVRKSFLLNNQNHDSIIKNSFEKLFEKNSFVKKQGSDHLFLLSHWTFSNWSSLRNKLIPEEIWEKIENVTCTRYEYFRMSKWENLLKTNPEICNPVSLFSVLWENTKKSIIVPYKTNYDDEIERYEYEDWKNRQNLIFYHTRKTKSAHNSTELRQLPITMKDSLRGSIGYDLTKEEWSKDFRNSKFSLVIRGDTPGSHSFVNSVLYGCIPIIISDLFETISLPFEIELESISIKIKEEDFLKKPDMLKQLTEEITVEEIQEKIKNLRHIQSLVLYNHPESLIVDKITEMFFK